MPIYQYNCQACGHQVEVLQKVNESPLTDCPECGTPALKKGVTAAAFRLKGSGWYETDFKNKSKAADKTDAKGGKETSSAAAKNGGAKSEDTGSSDSKISSGTKAREG